MRVVWKFVVPIGHAMSDISMPVRAKIIHVGQQDDKDSVVFWALVTPSNLRESRKFTVFGTGFSIDDLGWRPVGSVIDSTGGFVWHLFEYIQVTEENASNK